MRHPRHINYEVSDFGRIRVVSGGKHLVDGECLSLSKSGAGYLYATIFPGRHTVRVNRLVLEAFIGLPKRDAVSRHLNGDKSDNRLSNLRWGTPKENSADRDVHGNTMRGSRNGNAKLTEDLVIEIRRLYLSGDYTQWELARRFGTSQARVSYVVNRGWSHVPAPDGVWPFSSDVEHEPMSRGQLEELRAQREIRIANGEPHGKEWRA